MRRPLLVTAGLLAVFALALPASAAGTQQAGEGVRVLHLSLDSLDPAEVGPQTPTLAQLQATGTWYERARGNHGPAATRHITTLVTGGWAGLTEPRSVAPSDPSAVDPVTLDDTAALPEQVDLAPIFGWLLGVPDPGVRDGGAAQWQGRVLQEAFARRPSPRCTTAAPTPSPSPTEIADPDATAAPAPLTAPAGRVTPTTPVTGGGACAALGVLAAGLGVTGLARDREDR